MTDTKKRVFFWCCKPLGLRCLRYLIDLQKTKNTFEIVGICLSSTDGASDKIRTLASQHSLPCFFDNDVIDIPNLHLGLCIGFPRKIAGEVIRKFTQGVVNLHFAPLPKYRGSGTLTHAIINKEKKYGVTFHYMDDKLDTGPILFVQLCTLSKVKTAFEIIHKIEDFAYIFFTKKIRQIISGNVNPIDQIKLIKKHNISPIFCTRKSIDDFYKLSLHWSFDKIYRHVRALTLGKTKQPFFERNGKKLYISLKESDV